MTPQEILGACAARDSHLTDSDRTLLALIRAKVDASEELTERDTRMLSAFEKAIVALPED